MASIAMISACCLSSIDCAISYSATAARALLSRPLRPARGPDGASATRACAVTAAARSGFGFAGAAFVTVFFVTTLLVLDVRRGRIDSDLRCWKGIQTRSNRLRPD